MLTRMGEARDWGNGGLPLKASLLGKMNKLEVHHIFPKAQLAELQATEVNALANFCFLTKETNVRSLIVCPRRISPRLRRTFRVPWHRNGFRPTKSYGK